MTDRLAESARAMTLRYENLSHNASCYLSRHAGGYECTCGLDKVKNDLREALAAFDVQKPDAWSYYFDDDSEKPRLTSSPALAEHRGGIGMTVEPLYKRSPCK